MRYTGKAIDPRRVATYTLNVEKENHEMTQKHTPGPWWQEGTVVYIGKTGDFLPSGSPNWGGFDLRNCPLPEANARLIAAAPDLLEALEAIIATWDGPKYNNFMADNIDLAHAAIAKAKGEAE